MDLTESASLIPIRRPVEVDRWPRGIAYRNGFKIIGTPLGFGGSRDAKLRFVSGLEDRPPRRHERVLLHRALLRPLSCNERGVDALAIEYGQKIRLGRMEIELYPNGMGPGAAQLKISFRNRDILYCGGIRSAVPLYSPNASVPRCDLLLIDIPAAAPKPLSPSRSAKDLAAWARAVTEEERPAVVLCGSKSAALDAVWSLRSAEYPITASRNLFELAHRCTEAIGRPHRLLRLEQRIPRSGIVLMTPEQWESRALLPDWKGFATAFAGPARNAPDGVTTFRFSEGEDRSGIIGYIKETGATQVVLGPRCDEVLVPKLEKAGIQVHRVTTPVQIPFPFFSRRL